MRTPRTPRASESSWTSPWRSWRPSEDNQFPQDQRAQQESKLVGLKTNLKTGPGLMFKERTVYPDLRAFLARLWQF